jgi:hypothetical protein
MDREHVRGAADKAKGAIKDTAGKMVGDVKDAATAPKTPEGICGRERASGTGANRQMRNARASLGGMLPCIQRGELLPIF